MQLKITKPFAEIQTDYDKKLKEVLYSFITNDCNFPEWKQANYNQRYTELAMKKLGGTITAAEQTELTNIESVITWKNQLITDTNAARASIQSATTVADIRTIESSITYTPPPFPL